MAPRSKVPSFLVPQNVSRVDRRRQSGGGRPRLRVHVQASPPRGRSGRSGGPMEAPGLGRGAGPGSRRRAGHSGEPFFFYLYIYYTIFPKKNQRFTQKKKNIFFLINRLIFLRKYSIIYIYR